MNPFLHLDQPQTSTAVDQIVRLLGAMLARPWHTTAVGVSGLILVALADARIDGYSLGVFYLVPLLALAWVLPRPLAAAACLTTAAVATGIDALSPYPHPPLAGQAWRAVTSAGLYLVAALLLTVVRDLYVKEYRLARVDQLTGLPNRRAFFEQAEQLFRDACLARSPLTLVMLDCDGFKLINDRWGHSAGDALLRLLASHVRTIARPADLAARLGGDEFVLLLPNTSAVQAAQLLRRLTGTEDPAEALPPISGGVVTFRGVAGSLDSLMSAADGMLYQAKQHPQPLVFAEVLGRTEVGVLPPHAFQPALA